MNDWLIERALLDEVPASHRNEVERLRDDPAVRARFSELRASNAKILAELAPGRVAAEVERRRRIADIERERRRQTLTRRLAWLGPAVAAAAALLVFLLRGAGPGDEMGERSKGDPRLELHRQVGANSELLRDGAVVADGDRVQIAYIAAGSQFGTIVSIDGRGSVTVHFPDRATEAAPLKQSGAIALPFAYELDDAPNYERFFFVTADHPFDLELVRHGAATLAADPRRARTGPLALPPHLAQRSYSLSKGPPR